MYMYVVVLMMLSSCKEHLAYGNYNAKQFAAGVSSTSMDFELLEVHVEVEITSMPVD